MGSPRAAVPVLSQSLGHPKLRVCGGGEEHLHVVVLVAIREGKELSSRRCEASVLSVEVVELHHTRCLDAAIVHEGRDECVHFLLRRAA